MKLYIKIHSRGIRVKYIKILSKTERKYTEYYLSLGSLSKQTSNNNKKEALKKKKKI